MLRVAHMRMPPAHSARIASSAVASSPPTCRLFPAVCSPARALHTSSAAKVYVPRPQLVPAVASAATSSGPQKVDIGPLLSAVAKRLMPGAEDSGNKYKMLWRTWWIDEQVGGDARRMAPLFVSCVAVGFGALIALLYSISPRDPLPDELLQVAKDTVARVDPALLRELDQERVESEARLPLWQRLCSMHLDSIMPPIRQRLDALERRVRGQGNDSSPSKLSLRCTAPFAQRSSEEHFPVAAAVRGEGPEDSKLRRVELWSLLPHTSLGRGELHVVAKADMRNLCNKDADGVEVITQRVRKPLGADVAVRDDGKYVLTPRRKKDAVRTGSDAPQVSSSPPLPPLSPEPAAPLILHNWQMEHLSLHFPDAKPQPRSFVLEPAAAASSTQRLVAHEGSQPHPACKRLKSLAWVNREAPALRARDAAFGMLPDSAWGQAALGLAVVSGAMLLRVLRPLDPRQLAWSRRMLCAVRDHPRARAALQLADWSSPSRFGWGTHRAKFTALQHRSYFVSEETEWTWKEHLQIGPRQLKQLYMIGVPPRAQLEVSAQKRVWAALGNRIQWGEWEGKEIVLTTVEGERIELQHEVDTGRRWWWNRKKTRSLAPVQPQVEEQKPTQQEKEPAQVESQEEEQAEPVADDVTASSATSQPVEENEAKLAAPKPKSRARRSGERKR